MAFRKTSKAKKFNGIFEYYRATDSLKVTRGFYFKYRDEFANSKMMKLASTNRDDALIESLDIRKSVKRAIEVFKQDERLLDKAKQTQSLTLNQLEQLYYESRTTKNRDQDHKAYLNRVSSQLGGKRLTKITTQDIRELDLSGYAPKTINITIDNLMGLFTYAISNGFLLKSPISRHSKYNTYIAKEHLSIERGRILTDDELQRLFDGVAHNKRLYLFVKMLYLSGARPDAILSLKVRDFNFGTGEVTIKPMKQASAYLQPLHKELIPLVREWITLHELKYDDAIFYPVQSYTAETDPHKRSLIKQKPTRYEALRAVATPIFDDLFNQNIPKSASMRRATFYTLRRTAATKVYQAFGLVQASQFLHHSDIRTTMHYLNIEGDMRGAVDAL